MADAVSLGTLSTSGGATRLFGSASKIDTAALVESLSAAKRLPADRLERKIEQNEARKAAWGELRDVLGQLQTAVGALRNPPGSLGAGENQFEAKEVYFSSSTTTPPSALLGVSADNTATSGKFDLVVEQLATARKFRADAATSADQPLAAARNGGTAFAGAITLGLAGSTSATIAINGTMSLTDVRAAINAQSGTTGITATVVKAGDTDYRLVLAANETGKEVTMAKASGDDVLGILGLSADGGATFKNAITAPQQAKLKLDGVEVTRSSNRITDVLPGVTLDLVKADPGTTVTVDVQTSLAGIKERIQGVVDAYNAMRDFVARQNARGSDGRPAEEAVLFNDPMLRSLSQRLSDAIARPVAGLTGSGPSNLEGIGVTFAKDNPDRLTIPPQREAGPTLDQMLLKDIEAVRDVLEFRFTASSSSLRVLDRAAIGDTSFNLVVTDGNNDGVPDAASADGVAFDIVGNTLVGRNGTAYAGLKLGWAGRGNETISVTATQGVADKLYVAIDAATDAVNGSLKETTDNLTNRSNDYRAEIGRIDERVQRYREQLIAKYQAMETAMSLAQSMLQQLKAAFGGNEDS